MNTGRAFPGSAGASPAEAMRAFVEHIAPAGEAPALPGWLLVVLALLSGAGLSAADRARVEAARPWIDRHSYTPVVISATTPGGVDSIADLRLTADHIRHHLHLDVPAGRRVSTTVCLRPTNDPYGYWHPNLSEEQATGWVNIQVDVLNISRSAAIWVKSGTLPPGVAVIDQVPPDGTGTPSGRAPNPAEAPPIALPDRWQCYPRWLVLILSPAAESDLTTGQRQAIATWLWLGGRLVLTDAGQAAGWRAGLGHVLVSPLATVEEGKEVQRALSQRPLLSGGMETGSNRKLVPGSEQGGVMGYAIVALLFLIIAGPLNLWWVRRRGQPALVLITIPALGAVACALLLSIDLVRFGLGFQRTAYELTVIDQVDHRAVQWTGATLFGGFTLGRLDLDAEALAIAARVNDDEPSGYRHRSRTGMGRTPPLRIEFADGRQRQSGAIVPGRRTVDLAITVPRAERRRVEVRIDAGAPVAVNGLGVAISELEWIAEDGTAWRTDALPAGGEARLENGTQDWQISPFPGADQLPGGAWSAWLELARKPGAWRARIDAALEPFPGPEAEDAVPIKRFAAGWANIAMSKESR